MLLGDLLARFEDETFALETILSGGLGLLAETHARAKASGLDLGSYLSQALCYYGDSAANEEWITLMGAMNRSDDPGAVYLKRALAHATGLIRRDK